jgi:amino acid transporter
MASTGVEVPGSAMAEYVIAERERENEIFEEKHEEARIDSRGSDSDSMKIVGDSTHRQLRPRHIQLIGIGGTIGTALYVQIGHGLLNGGPGSLFLAFTIWYVINMGDTKEMGAFGTMGKPSTHPSLSVDHFEPPSYPIM